MRFLSLLIQAPNAVPERLRSRAGDAVSAGHLGGYAREIHPAQRMPSAALIPLAHAPVMPREVPAPSPTI